MAYMNINGMEIYYNTFNFKSVNSRKTVSLLIHGAGGSSVHWQPLLEKMNESHPFITIDLPGHGRSSGETLKDLNEINQIIHAVIKKMEIKQMNLIGHSVGGFIALNFTVNYPQYIEKLALICSSDRVRLHPNFIEQAKKSLGI
ncbi:alpha/beta fold hydrolase [Bacillus cytotoxicus]